MAISSAALYLPFRPNLTPSLSLSSSNSSFLSPSCPLTYRSLVARTRPTNVRQKMFSCSCIFGLGVPELVVIAGVAALVFGPKKLPEVGKSIGKTVKSFQQAAKEFESELKKEPESVDEATEAKPVAVSKGVQENDTAVSAPKDSV